ncbi:MAG: hypothetical protein AAF456_12875 [Planctomycetota bacterium]
MPRHRRFPLFLLPAIFAICFAAPANLLSQESNEEAAVVQSQIQITSIRRGREAGVEPDNDDFVPAIWLRDTLIVTVTDAEQLLANGPVDLYFNGDKLPIRRPLRVGDNQLEFKIDNEATGKEHEFFKQIFSEPWVYERTVKVSVGNANGQILQNVPRELVLRVVHLRHFVIWVVAMVALGIVMWTLGWRTGMLREWGEQGAAGGLNRFSLARCQMAFWFVLVVAAFSFIFLVIDKTDTIPMSMVVLMGISSATAVSAVMIESGKKADAQRQLAVERSRLAASDVIAHSLESATGDSGSQEVVHLIESARINCDRETSRARIAELEQARLVRPTRSVAQDLLSTGEGYSLHRVQIVVWTIALGVVFVSQVMKDLSMPVFDANLLALMGVSSGTYLGFKFPERG